MLNGNGEWLWRPVSNRETLQVSAFVDTNPRGFGFLQRQRTFEAYQDDNQHWELRPSLWIEPIGEWGAGEVTLVEIPSESEVNDNIVAYWRPKPGLAGRIGNLFRLSAVLVLDAADATAHGLGDMDSRSGQARPASRQTHAAAAFWSTLQAMYSPTPNGRPKSRPASTASPGAISGVQHLSWTASAKAFAFIFDMDAGSEKSERACA